MKHRSRGRSRAEVRIAPSTCSYPFITLRPSRIPSTAVAETIIREFRKETSGRSWSCRCVPEEPRFRITGGSSATTCFLRLHPDWKEDQADEVRSACTNEERTCSSR